jgi:hypothetical protein
VAAGRTTTIETGAWITRQFLCNRTNSTYRFQSTKQRGLRFGARLTVETLNIELALVYWSISIKLA